MTATEITVQVAHLAIAAVFMALGIWTGVTYERDRAARRRTISALIRYNNHTKETNR